MMKKPVILIVMDGFGLSDSDTGNAIHMAKTPNIELLMKEYPTSSLQASGLSVGLPEGQMGNSEVGHLNLGGGRIVYQSLTRINKAISEGTFFTNEAYLNAIENAKANDSKLHIMGLLSDGGVHSHIEHIKAFFKLAKDNGVEEAYFHAFLDGRDTPPDSGVNYIKDLEAYMTEINYGKVASVGGRYYGMDRDKNWDRVQLHYDVFVEAKGPHYDNAVEGIEASYNTGVYDEFVIPFNVVPEGIMEDKDSIIFANFRPDRAIEIGTALSNPELSGLDSSNGPTDLTFVSTMSYSQNVKGEIAFGLQKLDNMYGDVISNAGKTQLRIAETEKYAHVTFFFDGGVDKQIKNSERVLVNSPKVATYDLQPEMSAYEVTDKILDEIAAEKHDTIILNFANCDMVGHTGIIPAAIKAVETVDECVGKVVDAILDKGGVALITADHGNAEKMLDENGNPFTAHTTSIVPLIITDKAIAIREGGILADVAPTMLEYLNIEQPEEMTGTSLVKK
ncbi:2,3-bisphosphoglycerate-independent phosphoglycerate mutase [Candidatus Izimaplasma bacterium HR1]|uniref:2,3-bisphosphoglycerate-independent phosphoglycerate mutase n=1 Tax=Candidatus Izimoplasma sp. HR1 TaxID=1541959 RepID=UPI00056DDF59